MEINGKTKLLGFFGSTYKTSKMYKMYNSAIDALGINYAYVPFAVDDLGKAIEGVKHLGITAIGLTIPYKVEVIQYIDELDESATRAQSVAVVVNRGGKLIGGNTDGVGAMEAIRESGIQLENKNILILGAGGTTRSVMFSVRDERANKVWILNRTVEKAEILAKLLGGETVAGGYEIIKSIMPEVDVIINTTSVGMSGTDTEGQSLISKELLRKEIGVLDVVNKPRETQLLIDAKEAGCKIAYGYRMLLWQGVHKFKLYTNGEVKPPIEVMNQAMEAMKNS